MLRVSPFQRPSSDPRPRRRAWRWLLVLAAVLVPAQALALDASLMRSLVLPGLGQVHKGHYTRGALLAGGAVLSGFGIMVSQVYYNEAVDKYRADQRLYDAYAKTLAEGGVVSIEDMRSTYASMQAQYDASEDRLLWRNAFIATFVAVYAVNIVDVLLSEPDRVDAVRPLALEVGPGSFRVTKAFRF